MNGTQNCIQVQYTASEKLVSMLHCYIRHGNGFDSAIRREFDDDAFLRGTWIDCGMGFFDDGPSSCRKNHDPPKISE
jgi:hypothetical protein